MIIVLGIFEIVLLLSELKLVGQNLNLVGKFNFTQ